MAKSGKKLKKGNYVYMLECADSSLYTGWTTDPYARERAHNSGRGAKYTRSRLPVRLVYIRRFETKEEAMREEARIKRLTRKEKLRLLREGSSPDTGPQIR